MFFLLLLFVCLVSSPLHLSVFSPFYVVMLLVASQLVASQSWLSLPVASRLATETHYTG
jgi:hypothetical protein